MNMNCQDDCGCNIGVVKQSLIGNVGKVVTIITESGGCSGEGFTGLVATICNDTLKLITTLPSAPGYPFEGRCCRRNCNDLSLCRQTCCSHFGSAVYIPLCKIVAVVVAEV